MIHRLHKRDPRTNRAVRGLSCDADGVHLGGDCALVAREEVDGRTDYRVREISAINKTLSTGYGVEVDISCHLPTLERVARLMTDGQLGLAQITVLQMGLPDLPDDDAVERLLKADALLRFNPNHKPAGPGGGQFTSAPDGPSVGVSTAGRKPGTGSRGIPNGDTRAEPKPNTGVTVTLPNGRRIPDPNSPTGFLMSPVADLGQVARAGRSIGAIYRQMLADPQAQSGAFGYLVGAIDAHVGQGGQFDYQRSGNRIVGFEQYRQFRDVSDFNVGLFMQQTGLFSLNGTLNISGEFAQVESSNARRGGSYGIDPRTSAWIATGYRTGESGVYGSAVP